MIYVHCSQLQESWLGFQMQTKGLEIMLYNDSVCIFVDTLLLLQRDTAGQERFYTFTKQFFRGTQVPYVHVCKSRPSQSN